MVLLRWIWLRHPAFRLTLLPIFVLTIAFSSWLPDDFVAFFGSVAAGHLLGAMLLGLPTIPLLLFSLLFTTIGLAVVGRDRHDDFWVGPLFGFLFYLALAVSWIVLGLILYANWQNIGWQEALAAALGFADTLLFVVQGESLGKRLAFYRSLLMGVALLPAFIAPATMLQVLGLVVSLENSEPLRDVALIAIASVHLTLGFGVEWWLKRNAHRVR